MTCIEDMPTAEYRRRHVIRGVGMPPALWEQLNNPGFNPVEFDGFRKQAGLNSFTLTPKQWIEKTGAIGLVSKPGRYGGTFAHLDIALEFAAWISVEFKLYLIKEFQRLREDERKSLDWDVRRNLAKVNYRIQTDAIKQNLIPAEVSKAQAAQTYASEADVLNVALFGISAKQWQDANPGENGNKPTVRLRSRDGTRGVAMPPAVGGFMAVWDWSRRRAADEKRGNWATGSCAKPWRFEQLSEGHPTLHLIARPVQTT